MKIIFAGTPEFAVPTLQVLFQSEHTICGVYTQPDRPAGRGRKLTESPVKKFALQHQLHVLQPASLREPRAQQELQQLDADLMVVVAYGLLLPPAVLTIPRLGCINVHASLLPRWRGAAPIQYAILTGDTTTGVSIMQMDTGLDTGPILKQAVCTIEKEDNSHRLHDKLAQLGAKTLLTTLTALVANQIKPVEQDETQATYATKIKKEQGQLDWTQSAEQLARQVRAFNPWPVAFTLWQQQTVRIWEAVALNTSHSVAPGTLIAAAPEGIDIAAGTGILRLLTLQLPGGKPQSAAHFVNAHRAMLQRGTVII